MRVLQINSVCGVGSTGRITTDIDKLLKENGHESYIAYGRGIAQNCDTTIKIGNQMDNYLHVAKTRIFDQHGLGSKKATIEFIKRAEELRPDVIHLHNIHGYYINIEVLFKYLKRASIPVVWTLHDCWSFTGHCAYFDFVNCDRWKLGCNYCPQKKSYPSSMIIDNSINNFRIKQRLFTDIDKLTIVTPSKWLSELVKESYLKEYPVSVINNGVDLSVFKPSSSTFRKQYNLENKFIILGVASVWEKRKGYDYFIKLSKEIKEDEIIVLIGISEHQKKNLPANILGISKTNNANELAGIYSAADVFVNPTLEDNFPTTNLESLACGTPVITFNTGGSVESLDEECGFIVSKGDIKDLKYTLEHIKQNGKAKFSLKCLEIVQNRFDKQDKYYDYIRVYSDMLLT